MSDLNLPEGWTRAAVGDYIYLKNGYAFKSDNYVSARDDTFPVIRISDLDGQEASDKNAVHVERGAAGFELNKGDLLIAMSGATTGKVGIYQGKEPAYQNQRVGNLKLHSEKYGCASYKNYLIASLSEQILKAAYGGAQPNISGKAIEEMAVLLPPLAEQKVIAEKLDTLLAQVETTKACLERIPDIIKRFRQSVLAAAVSGRLTEEWRGENKAWPEKRLRELCRSISDGDHQAPPRADSGIPFLVISNVNKGFIDFSCVERWVPQTYFDELKDIRRPEKNDILYTVTGSFGIPVLVDTDRDFCFQRHIAILKPDHHHLNCKFLFYLLGSIHAFKQADSSATGTAQRTVALNSLRDFVFEIPPLEEQAQIVRRVEQLFAFADTIEQKANAALERVNNLTQSILAKAFKGELTEQWRTENQDLITGENSAEALLEKIKAEREAVATKKKARTKKDA